MANLSVRSVTFTIHRGSSWVNVWGAALFMLYLLFTPCSSSLNTSFQSSIMGFSHLSYLGHISDVYQLMESRCVRSHRIIVLVSITQYIFYFWNQGTCTSILIFSDDRLNQSWYSIPTCTSWWREYGVSPHTRIPRSPTRCKNNLQNQLNYSPPPPRPRIGRTFPFCQRLAPKQVGYWISVCHRHSVSAIT